MVNRENRFGEDNKEGADPEDELLDEGGWLVFSWGHSERKKDMYSKHKLEKKRVHSVKNYKLIQYLKTKECKTLM